MHGSPHRSRGTSQLATKAGITHAEGSRGSSLPSAPASPATPRAAHFQSPLREASTAGRAASCFGAQPPLASPRFNPPAASTAHRATRLRSLTYPRQTAQRPGTGSSLAPASVVRATIRCLHARPALQPHKEIGGKCLHLGTAACRAGPGWTKRSGQWSCFTATAASSHRPGTAVSLRSQRQNAAALTRQPAAACSQRMAPRAPMLSAASATAQYAFLSFTVQSCFAYLFLPIAISASPPIFSVCTASLECAVAGLRDRCCRRPSRRTAQSALSWIGRWMLMWGLTSACWHWRHS